MNTSKNRIIALLVILAVVSYIFYRQVVVDYLWSDVEEIPVVEEQATLRELATTVSYEVPGGEHTIRFSTYVDDDGIVRDVKAIDTTDPDSQQKVDEFAMTLKNMIGGKKISELEPLDRVGTSSLTTEAFNEGLAELKAQF